MSRKSLTSFTSLAAFVLLLQQQAMVAAPDQPGTPTQSGTLAQPGAFTQPGTFEQPGALTKQAANSFEKGNLQDAVDLQTKAVAEKPNDWLSHSALSFYSWQQGDIVKAVDEGQASVNLAPHNYVAVTDLALIKEGLDDCKAAIPLYEEGRKVSPNNYVPWLGLARCQIKSGNESAGLDVLKEMSAKDNRSFQWYYELADTILRLEKKSALATAPAEKAFSLASTEEQKQTSSMELFNVYLQNNDVQKATKLRQTVFAQYQAHDSQLYTRAASVDLGPEELDAGKTILSSALKNLSTEEDCEGFFNLARIFEDKALASKTESAQAKGWLSYAEQAYNRAISLGQGKPFSEIKYFLGLAGVYERQGKLKEMNNELSKIKTLDNTDVFSNFLLAALGTQSTEKTESADSAKQHCKLNLTNVSFEITNLNCGCQVSKVVEAMEKSDGVAYVHVQTNKPFKGNLLLDQSKSQLKDVLAKTAERVKAIYASMTTPIVPEFRVCSTSDVASAADAIRLAEDMQNGPTTSYYTSFKAVVPFEPVSISQKSIDM